MTVISEFRKEKDHFVGHDEQSPLTDDQKRDFNGLKYFDENPSLSFIVKPQLFEGENFVSMQTSTGDVAEYIRWAKIAFEVEGEQAELTIYKDSHGGEFFLPFADATSGTETYGAGRYLEVQQTHDGQLLVDFNYAYNPYCAYNESWSCPLTPAENRAKVAIKAGEKTFK